MLDTTKMPNVENPLSNDEKDKEIQRVRDFMKKRIQTPISQNW